jgi:hypothetical protein
MSILIKYNHVNDKLIEINSFNTIIEYDKVVYINCEYNQFTELPELPNSLKILSCSINKLIKKQKYKYLKKFIYL